MTDKNTLQPPLLTDDEIMRSAINASDSLNITRFHEMGSPPRTIMDDAGLLELCRAIETAVLSKLRAPVADERAAKLDAECNSLAHQLNASNERNGALRAALSDCSAELFAQCGDQSRAMSYVNAARAALAAQPAASDEHLIETGCYQTVIDRHSQPAASAEPAAQQIGYIKIGVDGCPRAQLTTSFGPGGELWADNTAIYAAPVAAQAPQESDEPLPAPGIHAAVHYAGWLRREAHRHQEPKASVLRQTARMLDVLQAECARLHQELIDAQALQQDADPCPQCIPGGVCKTPTCGRLLAAQASGKAQDAEDAARLDWLDEYAHCADWVDGEPTKRVIRADDGAEFQGDTWRAAIDAAMQHTSGSEK